MSASRPRLLVGLLIVNLFLQLFDGVATYFGIAAGYGEGNPLVAASFDWFGVGPALCFAKTYACGCLVLIWYLGRRSSLAVPAMIGTAVVYMAASVAPWSVAFATL